MMRPRYKLQARLIHHHTGEPWYKFTKTSGAGPNIIRIRVSEFW